MMHVQYLALINFNIITLICAKASFSPFLLILLDVLTDLVGSMQECGTMLSLSTMLENTSSISGTTPATAAAMTRNRGISSFWGREPEHREAG